MRSVFYNSLLEDITQVTGWCIMYVFTRIFMRPQSLQNLGSIKMLKFVGPLSYYPWTRVTVSMQDNMWTSLHTLASCEPESSPLSSWTSKPKSLRLKTWSLLPKMSGCFAISYHDMLFVHVQSLDFECSISELTSTNLFKIIIILVVLHLSRKEKSQPPWKSAYLRWFPAIRSL